MWLFASEVSTYYYTCPPGIVSLLMLTIIYIQAMPLHITQGRFNIHAVRSSYRIMVTATSLMGVMKMGNIVPRVRIELTSLAFRACATITPNMLHDVTTIPTSTCLCGFLPQRPVQTTTLPFKIEVPSSINEIDYND